MKALFFVGFARYVTQEVKTVCIEFHGAKIVFSFQTLVIATIQAQKLSKFEREFLGETFAKMGFVFCDHGGILYGARNASRGRLSYL